ncbi:HNH endonuclease [Sphingobium sp.]|uniref:HNH endonuclease n=1 Tax=Sphingobium sp. TaxID=1912891 RepID=UPI002CAFB37F|nr:HNH endonuclease [Sphingobium sp.]HUD90085.1 HNH endonuclease [Sphingobium sp.]
MAKSPIPTPEELRQLLDYDPLTGKLFWRERSLALFEARGVKHPHRAQITWNRRLAGKEAFTGLDGGGYRQGTIFGRYFKASRVIWAIFHGVWPSEEVGYVDGDRTNTRISNLRDVPHSVIQKNSRLNKTNSSGVSGVSWNRVHEKWQASIGCNGKPKALGVFVKLEDAIAARRLAEKELGYAAAHGMRRPENNKFVPKSQR